MSNAQAWNQMYVENGHLSRWQYDRPTQELVAAEVCGVIPEGGACLDLGCGTGNESIFLAETGRRAYGIDLSERAVEIARETAAKQPSLHVEFRQGSVLELPYADGMFDFAMDRGCFHHINDEQRAAYARGLKRVLKPGARCLLRACRGLDELPPQMRSSFNPVNEEVMKAVFGVEGFTWTPLRKISLISNAPAGGEGLPAFVTLLTRPKS